MVDSTFRSLYEAIHNHEETTIVLHDLGEEKTEITVRSGEHESSFVLDTAPPSLEEIISGNLRPDLVVSTRVGEFIESYGHGLVSPNDETYEEWANSLEQQNNESSVN